MKISLIAAVARNGGIGKDNALLWDFPEDLQFFKKTTLGCTIVMGRKTFESIGKPLPGRRNIVITRNPAWGAVGVECLPALDKALDLLKDERQIFIIGGAQLYSEALRYADELILTHIDKDFAADTFFPKWDTKLFQPVARQRHWSDGLACHYEFVTYQRIAR